MKRKLFIAFIAIVALLAAAFGIFGLTACSTSSTSSTSTTHRHELIEHSPAQATCTTTGNSLYYSCSGCDKIFSNRAAFQEIQNVDSVTTPKLSHNMSYTAKVEATCVSVGNVEYYTCSICNLNYSDSNGTTQLPNVTIQIDSTNHVHKQATIGMPATCTTTGIRAYFICDDCNKWYDGTDGITEIKDYDSVILPLVEHSYASTVTIAATCENSGVLTYTCIYDSAHKYVETIPATGHYWMAGKTTVAATCEADGLNTFVCKNDDTHTYTETIHATGHIWNGGKDTKVATCEEDGQITYTCTNDSSHTKVENVSAIGHEWGDGAVTKAATCNAAGTKTYICSNDNAHTKTESIQSTGHIWTGGSLTKAATCTEAGVWTYTCVNDKKHTYTKTIAATGHNFVDNVCTVCHKAPYTSGLEYTKLSSGKEYAVTGIGSATGVDISIAPVYESLPVTAIGNAAFSGKNASTGESTACANIVSVTIPDSVTTIGDGAFAYCSNLSDVTIPNSVTTIGSSAFSDCSSLTEIVIPDSVESIGDKAFYNCETLTSVTMSDTVDVGKDVFRGSINVEISYQHALNYVQAKAATCDEAGNIAYYVCTQCGEYFEDANGQKRLYTVEISPSHDFVDGVCTRCGKILSSVNIVSIDTVADLGKFALGTMENAIGLPEKINVSTGDGLSHELTVNWDISNYKKNVVGTYTIVGHLQLGIYHLADGLSDEVKTTITIVDYMTGTADIVFVIDTTGSMSSSITNVKNNITAFAEDLEAAGVSARWSIVDYRDITCDGIDSTHIVMNGASDWYTNATEFKSAIDGLSVNGGGDLPETPIDGLMKAMTLTTRKDARTFYVLVTDASYKVNNNYGIASMSEAIDKLVDEDINVSVITNTGYYSNYNSLVDQTGGTIANISNSDFKSELFDKLITIIQKQVND